MNWDMLDTIREICQSVSILVTMVYLFHYKEEK